MKLCITITSIDTSTNIRCYKNSNYNLVVIFKNK